MATKPLSDLTATWNAAGTTFTAIKMNVTDTASAAGSALMDLQVGGVSQFKVSKAGAVTAVGVAVPTISSTDTLTNKTLSSPTLSGTVAGSPTFSGSLTLAGGHQRITQASTGTSPAASGNSLTDIILRIGASNVGTAGYGLDFGTSNATGQVWLQARDWNNYANNVAINLNPNGGGATLGGVAVPTISSTDTLSNKTLSGVTIADATNIALATGTGTKIGTATTQKLGFYNATPVVQPTAVADATDAASAITQLNALLTRMRNLGLIAT